MSAEQLNDDFPLQMEREAGAPANVDAVAVAFGIVPKRHGKKSEAAGHDVFEDVEYVKICVPGDQKTVFFQPADDTHRRRFPNAYRAYKDREHGAAVEGMPIEHWAVITRSMALTFKAGHVPTVEALAAVTDAHIDRFGTAARDLRAKARTWLAEAKDGAAAAQVASENEKLKRQLEAMQAQITALNDRLKPADRIAVTGGNVPISRIPDTAADVQQDVVAAARRPRKSAAA